MSVTWPLEEGDTNVPLLTLCERGVERLDVGGAGVSLVTSAGYRSSLCATDAVSARIEDLQVSLGEGPCVDAWSQGAPVHAPDLSGAPVRWPAFSPAASAAGAAAVFSVPLQLGQARFGALDVYRPQPGPLSREDLTDTLRLGAAVTQALLRLEPDGSGSLRDLTGGLEQGVEVFQASGMVSVQLDVSVEEALVRLRAHAFATDRTLREVAHDVVSRRLRLDDDR